VPSSFPAAAGWDWRCCCIWKDIGSVAGVFWIARRQTDKTGRFGYKQKSENGSVQTDRIQ